MLNRVLMENNVTQSDLCAPSHAARLGGLLGADGVVTGTVTAARDDLAQPRSDDPRIGTPASFQILGVAELGDDWPVKNGQGATMGVYRAGEGGIVFNAATIDWPKQLDQDAHVAQITRNVLMRLSEP